MTLLIAKPTGGKVVLAQTYTEGDRYFSNVGLLLHGNGTNGSTNIVDSSPSPKTVTAFGNAQISTAQSKFGGASIAFDGTNDYLKATNTLLALGAGDFTIELWLRRVNTSTTEIYIDFRLNEPEGNLLLYSTANGASLRAYVNGADRITGGALASATWQHVAVCRASGSTKLFIDGTQSGSTYSDNNSYASTTVTVGGRFAATTGDFLSPNGFIDDLRITKGVARYTSNFTPPTAPFADAQF